MSQSALKLRTSPAFAPTRPPLRVVTGGFAARQAWLAIVAGVTLVAGLIITLMINTALAEGTYQLGALERQSNELADRQEVLTHELDGLRAPAALAIRATKIGMVPASSPAFIRLSDGQVLGVAEAATDKVGFTVITSPTAPSSRATTPAGSAPTKATTMSTTATAKPKAATGTTTKKG